MSHAAPGGKMEQLRREIAASGRPLLALDSPHNAALALLGAKLLTPDEVAGRGRTLYAG